MEINCISKVAEVLYTNPEEEIRNKILYGGRGSTKSWSIADYVVQKNAFNPCRGLCTREFQGSIRDSVYRLLLDRIYFHSLQNYFVILKDSIAGKCGSEIIFKGLRTNASEIQSTEGLDWAWVEEAEKVREDSWDILTPTIRKPGSELIVSFNPNDEKSATYTKFIEKDGKSVDIPNTKRAFVNWWDNPWFPEVLRREMEWCRKNDPEKYEHIWAGKPKKYGQAVIFKNKIRIETFEPADDRTQFYFGADFGYATDPSCLVRMFIRDRILYIDKEFYGYGIEIDDLPRCWDTVPKSRDYKIRADSSRPDTISFMCKQGFNCVGAEKGPGSVEDGIEFLKNFEAIIIDPECKGSAGDYADYRWKVDRVTNEILPIPLDKSNHSPDASRYGLEPHIKSKTSIFELDYKAVNEGPLGQFLRGER